LRQIEIPRKKIDPKTFYSFILPMLKVLPDAPELLSKGDRSLKMTFEDQLKAIIYLPFTGA